MCVLKSISTLACWGVNSNGQCDIPEQFNSEIEYLTTGSVATCAIK